MLTLTEPHAHPQGKGRPGNARGRCLALMHEFSPARHAPNHPGCAVGCAAARGRRSRRSVPRGRVEPGAKQDRRSGAASEPPRCAGHRHAPARWRRPPVSRGDRSGGAAGRGGGRVWVWTRHGKTQVRAPPAGLIDNNTELIMPKSRGDPCRDYAEIVEAPTGSGLATSARLRIGCATAACLPAPPEVSPRPPRATRARSVEETPCRNPYLRCVS